MKQLFSINRKTLLGAAAAVIIIANVGVLSKVAYNRSSVSQQITLTEREVQQRFRNSHENSATALRIDWQTPQKDNDNLYYHRHSLTVSDETLHSLGLEKVCNNDYSYRRVEREAWVLLELNGLAYQQHQQKLEQDITERRRQAEGDQQILNRLHKELQDFKDERSRLYAIAIAKDKDSLLTTAGSAGEHLVVKGLISQYDRCNNQIQINQLYLSPLHAPHELLTQSQGLPEHYALDIAIGALNEAWIKGIQAR